MTYKSSPLNNSNKQEQEEETELNTWSPEEDNPTGGVANSTLNLEDAYFKNLYQKSLNSLLKEGYLDSEETRTGVRNIPVGLLSWWRDVVHQESNLSLSKLQRISINHNFGYTRSVIFICNLTAYTAA